MIDIKKLKENPDYYKQSSKNKNSNLDKEIDQIIIDHESYLVMLHKEQDLREKLNKISSEFPTIKDNELKKQTSLKAKEISKQADETTDDIKQLKKDIEEKMSFIPNDPLESVPISLDEKDNVEIKRVFDELRKFEGKPHWEILEENDWVLNKEAVYQSGSRNVIYKGEAAKLVKAIEAYMIKTHTQNGYELIDTPIIVNQEMLFNTTQLPKMEEDLYKLENGQYLIPTAEVTLTNLGANKIFELNELPKKYVASTSCFRKEAGAAGRDTRGIIRLHQFRKVELVKIVHPKDGLEELELMLQDACSILDGFKLPYRIIQLVTGDLSFGSKITYDIEVWMPSIKGYREISSVSLMGDFQARRMKSRFKSEAGRNELVYTLNGSGLAIDRTLAAILENYQEKDQILKLFK